LGRKVIAAARRAWASLRGDGEFSVTVPTMDGALNPNNALERAPVVASAESPDNLCLLGDKLLFSSGDQVMEIGDGPARAFASFGAVVTSLAADGETLAVALADGRILIRGGPHDGRALTTVGGRPLTCVTALAFADPDALLICMGSETHPFERWKHDLMQHGSSGSVWRVNLHSGDVELLAQRLGFPMGVLALADGSSLVAESWRHRLLVVRPGRAPETALSDLPAYPARLAATLDGAWLALFAPRRQLTEFILREAAYLKQMMAEIAPDYWVGPTLAPMSSFLEPLQGGTLKKLAAIKPWAPSRSYGLVVRLDADWQPTSSFHSRADGSRHGVMSALEHGGRLYAASRGAHAVVAVDLTGNE
jgi:hypothetical protein